MTVTITIEAHPDRGSERDQIDAAMAALGFTRATTSAPGIVGKRADMIIGDEAKQPPVDNDHVAEGATAFAQAEVEANAPKRERGKPSPGRARRTKEEIAEDEAAEKAEAAAANISTDPENRVDPKNPDDPETETQDAADEQAEVEGKELTREDVKAAMTGYVRKYGMPATQEDGPKIFLEALGKPPAGEDYWKLSLLPEDQDALAKVIATWNKATELNPLKREVVGA